MKAIFHSLGSNYSWKFAFKCLGTFLFTSKKKSKKKQKQLNQILVNQFPQKEIFYFYKGREALTFALMQINLPVNSLVLTPAFSCCAIEKAILQANLKPIFLDLAENQTKPDFDSIRQAYQKDPNIKVILLQNTFGYFNDCQEIIKFCQKNNILLIQDLAQSFVLSNNQYHHQFNEAEIIILSFGRDKILDAVSGGACLINQSLLKNMHFSQTKKNTRMNKNDFNQKKLLIIKDFFYPFLMNLIRATYQLKIGKSLLFFFKKINFFPSPAGDTNRYPTPLHFKYFPLIISQMENLKLQLQHRQKIATYYFNHLEKKNLQFLINLRDIEFGANLRFPCQLNSSKQKKALLNFLKQKYIYLFDNWYQKVIDCGSLKFYSCYQLSSCPRAEKLSQTILNLPTHININSSEAKEITSLINQFFLLKKTDQ